MLGALVFCLALAGPPMTAGPLTAGIVRADAELPVPLSNTERPPILSLVDRALGPVASLPGHATELAGLFVLGLSLIGAGRVLGHRPAHRGARARMVVSRRPRLVVRPSALAAPVAFRRSAR
ncbi:MAG: hypothetical protein AB1806_16165 [Acidobacteriota bacterium]